jgi:carbon-monoxide dehydrogenase medium subunit
MASPGDFLRAGSIDEAVALLASRGGDAQPLAGGTDVMIQLRRGQIAPSALLYLGELRDADGVRTGTRLRFGPLTTHQQIWSSPAVRTAMPGLVSAARQIGGWQTQSIGTLVGNIANASPAADLVPALLTTDAEVELTGPGGSRTVPLDGFITGRRRTAREPDELITGVSAAAGGAATADVFVKVGRRSAMEVSIVSVAVRLTSDRGVIDDARIAVGSAGPVPFRAGEAERLLGGARPDPELWRQAAALAAAQASPIDDIRASASYRRRVLPRVIARALADCWDQLDSDQKVVA